MRAATSSELFEWRLFNPKTFDPEKGGFRGKFSVAVIYQTR